MSSPLFPSDSSSSGDDDEELPLSTVLSLDGNVVKAENQRSLASDGQEEDLRRPQSTQDVSDDAMPSPTFDLDANLDLRPWRIVGGQRSEPNSPPTTPASSWDGTPVSPELRADDHNLSFCDRDGRSPELRLSNGSAPNSSGGQCAVATNGPSAEDCDLCDDENSEEHKMWTDSSFSLSKAAEQEPPRSLPYHPAPPLLSPFPLFGNQQPLLPFQLSFYHGLGQSSANDGDNCSDRSSCYSCFSDQEINFRRQIFGDHTYARSRTLRDEVSDSDDTESYIPRNSECLEEGINFERFLNEDERYGALRCTVCRNLLSALPEPVQQSSMGEAQLLTFHAQLRLYCQCSKAKKLQIEDAYIAIQCLSEHLKMETDDVMELLSCGPDIVKKARKFTESL